MAFEGFNKNSGPSFPPKTPTSFGNFPKTPPSENPIKKPISAQQQQTPRLGQNTDLVFDNGGSTASQRKRTPPLAFENKNYNENHHYPFGQAQRTAIYPPKWGNQPKSPINEDDSQARQQPPPVSAYFATHDAGTRFPTSPSNFQLPKRTRSPPLPSADEAFIRTYPSAQGDSERATLSPPKWGNQSKSPVNDANFQTNQWPSSVSPYSDAHDARNRFSIRPPNFQIRKGARSPPLPYADEAFLEHLYSSRDDTGRPAVSPPRWGNQPKSPVHAANFQAHQEIPPVSTYVETHDGGGNFPAAKLPNFQTPKRARSPPVPSANEAFLRNSHSVQDDTQRPAVSPPRWGNWLKSPVNDAKLQAHQGLPPVSIYVEAHDGGTNFPAKPSNFQVPKRARSPPVPSANEASLGNSRSVQDDAGRETQAKAKRLARFNVELSQPVLTSHDLTKNKFTGNKHNQNLVERRKFLADHPVEGGEFTNDTIVTDYEGLEPSNVVIGLCPDMCPEPEREERERKGDLDKFERLDGERNQTSKALAVKKYNRTAEREADLIRPMPVLQKTVDYLMDLLDQPYDDKFLGMYNFLWDRMRAIRMDLRMQHIFNQDAITMLEQMIRLHVIAMHELCEYTKGEGFSEGFDGHLNIEQMNKASVELFQMYDDHRKKGNSVPTEKEFRGYYALLKLDRHPGYKVEPAELSLDLAKMTPEIRCTPEILFARDVARACRTGNFIAFFRLAKKATYLQACLMHAHFSKLRTQALASLHSGLQNNQGIPIARIVKWLGMEEEDIESLLEYHGFLIKKFEVEYMVKEGPFLNGDKEYESKCSRLVHLKKSRRIISDVSSGQVSSWPSEGPKLVLENVVDKFDQKAVDFVEPETLVDLGDEEMPDYEDVSAPRHGFQVWPMLKGSSSNFQGHEKDSQLSELGLLSSDDTSGLHSLPTEIIRLEDVHMNSLPEEIMVSTMKGIIPQIEASGGLHSHSMVENPLPQIFVVKNRENEGAKMLRQKDEASIAKLKLILRIWKRRASKLREFREHHQLVANAAMNSLSLGLPIRQNKEQPRHSGEFNIDHVVRERHHKYGISWSRLNVSEVIGPILRERNPNAKCLCWKLVVCSQMNDSGVLGSTQRSQTNNLASTWLLSKLTSIGKEDDSELAVSSMSLTIWKKWVGSGIQGDQTCCLSVIRDAVFENDRPVSVDDLVAGAGAILFLVSENNPWELQRIRLHNVIMSLPSGSSLPLLILNGGIYYQEIPDPSLMIINKLGLSDVDKTRISNISVVSLVENQPLEHFSGFYSDDNVRGGLKWLANQSPAQPVLRQVKTRDLVLSYLGASLEVLDNMNISEVGPDHCISAFNEALDRTAEEIVAAADANHVHWPSPEIDLLEKSSKEHRAVNFFLPSAGWSSDAITKPIVSKLKSCKMPRFAQDLSWLNQDSDTGKEIRNQKSVLDRCLNCYLTQESKIMSGDLAAKEASVMLQKGATLVLNGSNYRIVPRWVVVFRRVFNWRLMNLADGSFSEAYVLKQNSWPSSAEPFDYPSGISTPLKAGLTESNVCMKPTSKSLNNSGLKGDKLSPYFFTELSLDEMIEVASLGCLRSESEDAVQPHSGPPAEALVLDTTSHSAKDGEDFRHDDGVAEAGGAYLPSVRNENSGSRLLSKRKEADKLSMLLEQCNLLQDKIDEKLAIYF